MSEGIGTFEKEVRKQTRQLMDIEKIEASDIILTEDGYDVVPIDMVGLRRSKIEAKDVRRWWGMISALREGK